MNNKTLTVPGKLTEEKGAVLVVALIMLCLLTIISTAVSKTSSIETLISGAERDKRETFYAAEAGVDHVKGLMSSLFLNRNNLKIAQGQTPDWDFALNGSEPGVDPASGTTQSGGATWISNARLNAKISYNVRIWNNDDGGGFTDDTDGIVFIRADASGVQGGSTSIEESIRGAVTGAAAITEYFQDYSNSSKTNESEDAEAIDFSQSSRQL